MERLDDLGPITLQTTRLHIDLSKNIITNS